MNEEFCPVLKRKSGLFTKVDKKAEDDIALVLGTREGPPKHA